LHSIGDSLDIFPKGAMLEGSEASLNPAMANADADVGLKGYPGTPGQSPTGQVPTPPMSQVDPAEAVAEAEENEMEDLPMRAENLFESLAVEPYETVFTNPRLSLGPLDRPENETAERKQSDAASTSPKHDAGLFIKNLDTNECRRLGDGALTSSFLPNSADEKAETYSEELAAAKAERKSAWSSWWAEKREKDEQLWKAAESGSVSQLRAALAPPEDGGSPCATVNSKSLYDKTALHIAASVGKVESIELLLDAGADLEARTTEGLTALHVACQRGHLSIATLLLDWDADISPQTKDHNLPLHFAATNGHVDVVALLLERGRPEQLSIRNSMGRRAAEVSLDIRTADAFKDHDKKIEAAIEEANGESSLATDNYAGRTAFHNGEVLIHNSRADAVTRLLNKMHKPQPQNTGSPMNEAERKPEKKLTNHAPFARVKEDSVIEKVGPDSFLLIDQLGKGSFGEVFEVKHKQTDQVYAMKILKKNKVMSGNLLRYTITERNVLSYINHPYIVSLHYAFQTHNYLVLLLQFCPGGNLQRLIEKEKRLQDPLAQMYTGEVLLALNHLHQRKIVFRDLKPDNVVIDEVGHSMLTDFGLSKEGVSMQMGTKSFCGSIAFIAPEILQRKGHNHTVDIYGLGVLLFDMMTGMPPFYDNNREKLYHNIKHARLGVPRWVAKPASSLIYALMEREPKARLGAADTEDVKQHEFFADLDFEALMRRELPPPVSFNTPSGGKSGSRSGSHRIPQHENPFNDGGSGRHQQMVSGWSFTGGAEPP